MEMFLARELDDGLDFVPRADFALQVDAFALGPVQSLFSDASEELVSFFLFFHDFTHCLRVLAPPLLNRNGVEICSESFRDRNGGSQGFLASLRTIVSVKQGASTQRDRGELGCTDAA